MKKENIITTLSLFNRNREIRVLGHQGDQRKIFSGVFSNTLDAIDKIEQLEKQKYVDGIYVSLNEVHSSLVTNKIVPIYEQKQRVSISTVVERTWFMIDLDPKVPIDFFPEKAKAIELWLKSNYDWPQPMIARSGKGIHMLYRTDPIAVGEISDSIFRRCLRAISSFYSNDSIDIDEKVYTASRHAKVYGTIVKKDGNEYQSEILQEFSGILTEQKMFSLAREIKEAIIVAPVSIDQTKLSSRTLSFMRNGAPSGQRNQELYIAACDFNGCGFSQESAFSSLYQASGLTETEVKATIKSAFKNNRSPSAKSQGDWKSMWSSFPYADHPKAYELDIRKIPEIIYMPWRKFSGMIAIKAIGGWVIENGDTIGNPSIIGHQYLSSNPVICKNVLDWLEKTKNQAAIMAINKDGEDIIRLR